MRAFSFALCSFKDHISVVSMSKFTFLYFSVQNLDRFSKGRLLVRSFSEEV